jgi:hypothetical protein
MAEARHSGKQKLSFEPDAKSAGSRCNMRTASPGEVRPLSSSRRSTKKKTARRFWSRATSSSSCFLILRRSCPKAGCRRSIRILRQSDGTLCHRRSGWRRGPDRTQNHRRHLRRRGPAWRRRILRQRPDQSRPLGDLCRALHREKHRRRRLRQGLHDSALLRDRRIETHLAVPEHAWHGQCAGSGYHQRDQPVDRPVAPRHPRAPETEPPDLRAHRGVRPFWP